MMVVCCFQSCPKGPSTVSESAHLQCGIHLYTRQAKSPRQLLLLLNQNRAYKVSMSKKVLHQDNNKSFNKLQNSEHRILAGLLQCHALGVILPLLHLLTQTNRSSCVQTHANTHIGQLEDTTKSTREGKPTCLTALNIQCENV